MRLAHEVPYGSGRACQRRQLNRLGYGEGGYLDVLPPLLLQGESPGAVDAIEQH